MDLRGNGSGLEGVLEVILRPVVRLCLRHGLKVKDLVELLKVVFVRVARAELVQQGEEESLSRIKVMSGVHRAEVARILKGKPQGARPMDVVTKVIGKWRSDKRYLTSAGKPRVLTSEGMASEFVQLVQSVSIDLNPYTVLFEMERLGFVERTNAGMRLQASVYIPKDVHEGYAMMADDVEDLMETVQENMAPQRAPEERSLHMKTEYDSIAVDDLPTVREWVRREGSKFHARVRDYLASVDQDISPRRRARGGRVRVALGTFSRVQIVQPAMTCEKPEGISEDR